ncbi:HPr kinase/phosphorylase [Oceaniglobus indicus]|uniref:HPr kinase/phosphorylase n=1 Tax=Oceaniglobus indicus TaxID=2047749 RepID=UPI000C1912D7|nr:serine kinase [Oceaniglobus indicus]
MNAGVIRHASCVALNARALLIVGASGRGKSALALELMAFGAGLVADDRTRLYRDGGVLIAAAPPTLPAMIEARGLGLLLADLHPPCDVAAIVDLDRSPTDRLPPPAHCDILGCAIPLLSGGIGRHLAPALVQFLKCGLAPVP